MSSKPTKITICTGCGREDVGVVLDWAHRDGNNQIVLRYRVAKHKVTYNVKDKAAPWCSMGRIEIPKELVFERG